jgi:type IV pilus assembly protein PilW
MNMKPLANGRQHARGTKRQRGLSIVDIMVGLTIGMLTILAILQFFVFWEGQKRTTTGGASAQTTGTHALFTIEQMLRNAGYGMGMTPSLGCTINRSYQGASLPSMKLVPVTITDGANGAADKIEILFSTADAFAVPIRVSKGQPNSATVFCVDNNMSIKVGDFIVAWDGNGLANACSLVQVTGVQVQGSGGPGCSTHFDHRSTSDWNPPGGQNIFPPSGYPTGSYLFNFGQFTDVEYSVTADYNLHEKASANTAALAVDQSIFPDIVTLQAEYGKDTNGVPDGVVDTWDAVSPVNAADWQRVFAVRLVVVARSALQEKDDVTFAGYVADNAPAWAVPLVDLTKNPDGSKNANWQKFRYKIFATVVPLRNAIWRQ